MQAIGAGAVNQATKAVAIAISYLQLDGVDAAIVRLSAFARMESLWVAQGRPAAPGDQMVGTEGQMVAMVRQPGADAAAH